jgi:hypothetical protein
MSYQHIKGIANKSTQAWRSSTSSFKTTITSLLSQLLASTEPSKHDADLLNEWLNQTGLESSGLGEYGELKSSGTRRKGTGLQ